MPWPKGVPRPLETREKIRLAHIGVPRSAAFIEKAKARSRTEEGIVQFQLCQEASRTPEVRAKANETLHLPDNLAHFIAQTKRIHIGRKRSQETIDKLIAAQQNNSEDKSKWMKDWWATKSLEERQQILSNAIIASRKANPSSIEIMTREFLDSINVKYEYSVSIGPYEADILCGNLIVECDGDYWHNLPGAKESDASKDEFCISLGYRVVRLTETQIRAREFSILQEALSVGR